MNISEHAPQYPGLTKKMDDIVGDLTKSISLDRLLKMAEILQSATIQNGAFYDKDGDLIGPINIEREGDIDINAITDELLQELLTGIGVDSNGEIARSTGAKYDVKEIIDGLLRRTQ